MPTNRRSGDRPRKNLPADGQVRKTEKKPEREDKGKEGSDTDKGEGQAASAPIPHNTSSTDEGSAGRPFWSGSITIGLVNVPVRVHTMVRDLSVRFRLLHKVDGQPLRYDRVCVRDNQVIPWNETVRGFEVRKGEYLILEPEDLKAVMPESSRKIKIEKFVFYLSLDPVYFETSYILTPDRSEEAYSLLLTVLQDLGRAAIGTITLRTKEYPVVIHVYGGGLVMTTLRYADEVTLPKTFEAVTSLPAPGKAELDLAKRIITDLSGDFSMADYHDRYREAVLALIESKLAGKKVVYAEPHPEEAKELMQALKETLATIPEK